MTEEFEREPAARRRWRIGAAAACGVAVLAVAATVATGVLQQVGSAGEQPIAIVSASADGAVDKGGSLTVHVSGAVVTPGVYVLPAGARVMDAISAAGGFTAEAAPDGLNLARVVSDGEQVMAGIVGAAPSDVTSGGSGHALIDLNTADVAELETLPRIGPALAQRIIDWRTENGPFRAVEDLLEVAGIGEKMFAAIEPLVRV